jgi:hypothetical protein
MNIGKLYQVKKFYCFLYPSKEIAVASVFRDGEASAAAALGVDPAAPDYAANYSKYFNCNVSYISPNSIFVFLEKDEKVIKILSTNGEVGWIYLSDFYKDDIEEVNQ